MPHTALAASTGLLVVVVIVAVLVLFAAFVAVLYLVVRRDNASLAAALPRGQWYAQVLDPGAVGSTGRLGLEPHALSFTPEGADTASWTLPVEGTSVGLMMLPGGPGVLLTGPDQVEHQLRISREQFTKMPWQRRLLATRQVSYVTDFVRMVERQQDAADRG